MGQAQKTALVLSGGGIRGAYGAGVMKAISEILSAANIPGPYFNLMAGTSAGAINASFLAGAAHTEDLRAEQLCSLWTSLSVEESMHFESVLPWLKELFSMKKKGGTPSILDASPFEELIQYGIDWQQLHRNISHGHLEALFVAALNLSNSRTSIFAEGGPRFSFRSSRDPRREARLQKIGPEEVLASAAVPVVFPLRQIGPDYYCDGGLRFNTPIAPAIRAGATRLVVVSVMHELPRAFEPVGQDALRPNVFFLLGKALHTLLQDPVVYDLQVLNRLNAMVSNLKQTLSADAFEKMERMLEENRGVTYREIETLVFAPSEDIGVYGRECLRELIPKLRSFRTRTWFLRQLAATDLGPSSDLASYFLFDGSLAARLIDLGYKDVYARKSDVLDFFAMPKNQP